jgi:hypothetical protein
MELAYSSSLSHGLSPADLHIISAHLRAPNLSLFYILAFCFLLCNPLLPYWIYIHDIALFWASPNSFIRDVKRGRAKARSYNVISYYEILHAIIVMQNIEVVKEFKLEDPKFDSCEQVVSN